MTFDRIPEDPELRALWDELGKLPVAPPSAESADRIAAHLREATASMQMNRSKTMTTRWVVAALLAGLLVGGAAGAALTDGQAHTAPTDVGALADRKDKSYLLLLHEDETLAAKFTGAQMDSIVGEYAAWGRQLHTENRLVSAEKLNDDGGRWLSPGGTESAARTGDILSGFFVIRASNYEEALRIAGASPHLKYGGRIEVREIEQTRS